MRIVKRGFAIGLLLGSFVTLSAKVYDVTGFGAKNDGKTLCTRSIQAAIDECTANGGGTVLLSGGGAYVSGTLFLKSNVTLHVDNGTMLLASKDTADFSKDTHQNMYKIERHMDRAFIFARDANSVAIEGYGTIDGNGAAFRKVRPMMIRFLNCTDIHLNNISLKNPAAWTSAWISCKNISVSGITIVSRANQNGDGLDFDGCSNVRVVNSNFDNSDDCICLQASSPEVPCMNVTVSNCVFTTKWGGMRIGLLSRGNIESVTVTNCTFRNIDDSGLKIQQNEGGEMRNMVFSNLVMVNVPRPIFMTFCQQRAADHSPEGVYEPLKRMHNFMFSNIIVDNSMLDKNSAILLSGIPGHNIEAINIRDVQFTVAGGGTKADAAKTNITEYTTDNLKGWWPEFSIVGTLPACGVYARHIDGLHLENVSVKTIASDARKMVVLSDVKNFSAQTLRLNYKPVAVKP